MVRLEEQDGIADELPRAMIGDIPSPLDPLYLYAQLSELRGRSQDVLLIASTPQRNHWIVLQQHESVIHTTSLTGLD